MQNNKAVKYRVAVLLNDVQTPKAVYPFYTKKAAEKFARGVAQSPLFVEATIFAPNGMQAVITKPEPAPTIAEAYGMQIDGTVTGREPEPEPVEMGAMLGFGGYDPSLDDSGGSDDERFERYLNTDLDDSGGSDVNEWEGE